MEIISLPNFPRGCVEESLRLAFDGSRQARSGAGNFSAETQKTR
jgi:hypothetical protein